MTLAAERELEHVGETSGCSDHDHDLIHELSRRLDSLWRYDQYVCQHGDDDAWHEADRFWEDDDAVGRLENPGECLAWETDDDEPVAMRWPR